MAMSLIANKVQLADSLKRMQKMFASDYQIFPKTWMFPMQGQKIKQYLELNQSQMIFKPIQKGDGGNIVIKTIE